MLRDRDIDTLIVVGATTSVCVESTVRDATFRDDRCLVVEDCTAEPIGATETRTNQASSLTVLKLLFAWITDAAAVVEQLGVTPAMRAGQGVGGRRWRASSVRDRTPRLR